MALQQDKREMEAQWFVQDILEQGPNRDKALHLHSRWWEDDDYHRILDGLKRADSRATFAFLGRDVPHRRNVIPRMVDEGHEVVTHASRHFLIDERFSREDLRDDLGPCVDELRSLGAAATGMWLWSRGGVGTEALRALTDVGIEWFASATVYDAAELPDGLRYVPSSGKSDLGIMYYDERPVEEAVRYWTDLVRNGNGVVLRHGLLNLARGDEAIMEGWVAFLRDSGGGVPAGEWQPEGSAPGLFFDASCHLGWAA